MFCEKCGNEIADDSQFCPKCGAKAEAAPAAEPAPAAEHPAAEQPAPEANSSQAGYQAPPAPQAAPAASYETIYPMTEQDKTLRLVAFVFNVLSCVGFGLLLVPLAWMIPMTVHSWGIYKGNKPNTVAFGVCTLLFLNLIGGIMLLVSKKDDE